MLFPPGCTSLGHWAGLLRNLFAWRHKGNRPDADFIWPEFAALYTKAGPELEAGAALLRRIHQSAETRISLRQLIDALVEYRNDQAHGAGYSAAHFAAFVPLLQAAIEETLLAVPSLSQRGLLFVESINIERGNMRVVSQVRLMSDRPRLRTLRETLGPADPQPEPQQVYLHSQTDSVAGISLHPLLVFLPACAVCGEAQVGILNGLVGQAAEYLCYGCGHSSSLRALAEDVARFLPNVVTEPPAIPAPPTTQLNEQPTARPVANALPIERTEFIGREHETAALGELLRRSSVHLVTLTGTGGCGKTRLALHVAAQLCADFANGVWFVDLASLTSAELVVPAIAAVIGLREEPGRPLIATLRVSLADKQMLLVLDNFEQVVAAAASLTELLISASGLKLLVTSRMPLQLYGEKVFAVEPLEVPRRNPLPPLDQLRQFAAVRLFVDRAHDVRDDFALSAENGPAVAAICARLDGLPLALELAAARVTVYSAHELLTRLDNSLKLLTRGSRDQPLRQQTLLATIKWSYELLQEDERALLQQLSVFVGGCTLDALQAVCKLADQADSDVLDLVQSLIDASLLQHESRAYHGRFRMLETIREYAMQCLAENQQQQALRRRHSDFFTQLALLAEPMLKGADLETWLNTLEAEDGNIRASLQWRIALRQPEETILAVRAANALYRYWMTHGHLQAGRKMLEAAVTALGEIEATDPIMQQNIALLSARALTGLGDLARGQADYTSAEAYLSRALHQYSSAADKAGEAVVLTSLGIVYTHSGNVAAAHTQHQQALALYRELGDQLGESHSLMNLAVAARNQGDYSSARSLAQQSLTMSRAAADKRRISNCLNLLGTIAVAEGELSMAAADFKESLALKRELKDLRGTSYSLEGFACLAALSGHVAQAARLFGGAGRLREELGTPLPPTEAEFYARYLAPLHDLAGAEVWATARAQGRRSSSDQMIDEALQLAEELTRIPAKGQ